MAPQTGRQTPGPKDKDPRYVPGSDKNYVADFQPYISFGRGGWQLAFVIRDGEKKPQEMTLSSVDHPLSNFNPNQYQSKRVYLVNIREQLQK